MRQWPRTSAPSDNPKHQEPPLSKENTRRGRATPSSKLAIVEDLGNPPQQSLCNMNSGDGRDLANFVLSVMSQIKTAIGQNRPRREAQRGEGGQTSSSRS